MPRTWEREGPGHREEGEVQEVRRELVSGLGRSSHTRLSCIQGDGEHSGTSGICEG